MTSTAPFSLFAHTIDVEIVNLVFNRFWEGLGSAISLVEWQSYRSILLSCVRSIYYYLSIQFGEITPGMKSMDIKWDNKTKQNVCALLAAGVGVEGLLSHCMSHLKQKEEQEPSESRLKYLYYFLHRTLFILHLCSTFNYIIFICRGRYPTLIHRLCGYQCVYAMESGGGDGSGGTTGRVKKAQGVLETRKLGWSKILGLASILFICIDWGKVRGSVREGGMYIHNMYKHIYNVVREGGRRVGRGRGGEEGAEDSAENNARNGAEASSGSMAWQCAECGTSPPENPQVQFCGHPVCYICWGKRKYKAEGKNENGNEKEDGSISCSLCS